MAEAGWDNNTVKLKLTEYAQMVGKTNLKELREQTNNDLQILKYVRIKSVSKLNNKQIVDTMLCQCSDKITNGSMTFKYNEDLFKMLKKNNFYRYLPLEILQYSEKITNAYLICKRIWSNTWTNIGKPTENKMKLGTIYNYCSTLPRVSVVNGAIKQKIVTPLIKNLNQINLFDYDITEEYKDKNFDDWLNADLIIRWKEELPEIEKERKQRKEKILKKRGGNS